MSVGAALCAGAVATCLARFVFVPVVGYFLGVFAPKKVRNAALATPLAKFIVVVPMEG